MSVAAEMSQMCRRGYDQLSNLAASAVFPAIPLRCNKKNSAPICQLHKPPAATVHFGRILVTAVIEHLTDTIYLDAKSKVHSSQPHIT